MVDLQGMKRGHMSAIARLFMEYIHADVYVDSTGTVVSMVKMNSFYPGNSPHVVELLAIPTCCLSTSMKWICPKLRRAV